MTDLVEFVRESNRIEGILREPLPEEIAVHENLLSAEKVETADLCSFVSIIAPGHRLRDSAGLNVRVGNHIAPPGGPEIRDCLEHLLANEANLSPWEQHVAYETLHPFTDGNGRSGRALWLHRHGGHAPLNFLHQFYYQTLGEIRHLEDKIDGLECDLDSAVETAYKRGATEWARLNYPNHWLVKKEQSGG